nr:MAG TPA: hypothetical protein [Bacteriophage sp.]
MTILYHTFYSKSREFLLFFTQVLCLFQNL